METKIRPNFKKPFRGLTTIQLFDKNTGELLEEHHDENTYNDRLQYINYFDTILKCKNLNIPSTFTPVSTDDSRTSFFDILSMYSMSTSGNNADVRQLFATLWLTNSTKAETAHGYPNGLPVGIADTAGVNPVYNNHAYSGVLNVSESYVGNDRLHLVFDFATDRCNVQFDALWLFPSRYRYYGSTNIANNYAVTSFYQTKEISSEVLDTQLLYTYKNFSVNHRINGNYTVLGYADGPGSSTPARALQILNISTGEIISTVEFSNPTPIYAPMYYDAGTNTLYTLRAASDTAINAVLGFNSEAYALYKLDMSSGTITKVDNLYNMLGLRWSDFDSSNTSSPRSTFVNVFKKDGSVATILRLKCTSATDNSTKNYHVLFNFDPVTETFMQVKKFEVFSDNAWETTSIFMVDDTVYLPYQLSSTQQTDYTFSAFDINTGAIKSTSIMSPNIRILGDYMIDYGLGSTDSSSKVYRLLDQATCRRALCVTSSDRDVAACKVLKKNYFTAPWSTHNKLTSAIKKTDMTTMKIQYDIVWDSISDVILPALL